MDAKLIKKNNIFYLYVDESWSIASTDAKDNRDKKLSLKNCQAIERGYDLENMADFYGAKAKGSLDFKLGANKGFEDGFQKALEILGDKKFSEEDMEDSFCEGKHRGIDDYNNRETRSLEYYDYINKKRTQQTEWDVIIKTTCDGMVTGLCCSEVCDCNIIPKLDADGCLVLKRKI